MTCKRFILLKWKFISIAHKSPKKNVNSERAHVLVAAVEKATANFAERGNQAKDL